MAATRNVKRKVYSSMDLKRMGITYDCGVVWHWTPLRGNTPLKRHVQNSNNDVYYIFKHNGKPIAIREEAILKAFVKE